MALTISDEGNAANAVGATTLVTGSTIDAASGDMLVAVVAADNDGSAGAASLASVIDSQSNTWTQQALINFDPGGAGAGATLGIFTAAITNVLSGGTVTANFSPSTGSKAIQVYRVQPGGGETVQFVAADATGTTGTGTAHAAATVSVTNGDTIFGAAAIETNDAVTGDSDTTDGSWSAIITRDSTNSMKCSSQYKTVSSTGNQSWECTTSGSRDSARSYLIIRAVTAGILLAADAGSYAVTGQTANLKVGHKVAANAGSYAITGQTASLEYGYKVAAAAGSYTITGQTVNLRITHKLAAEAGSYAVSGQVASLEYGRLLSAEAGSYVITGSDAGLIASSSPDKVITADPGSYVVTGQDASLERGYYVTAAPGSYVLTGSDANLEYGYRVTAVSGSFAITGQTASLLVGRHLVADAGSYAITGSDVALRSTRSIDADAGAYTIVGSDAGLIYLVPGTPRVWLPVFGDWTVRVKTQEPVLGVAEDSLQPVQVSPSSNFATAPLRVMSSEPIPLRVRTS